MELVIPCPLCGDLIRIGLRKAKTRPKALRDGMANHFRAQHASIGIRERSLLADRVEAQYS